MLHLQFLNNYMSKFPFTTDYPFTNDQIDEIHRIVKESADKNNCPKQHELALQIEDLIVNHPDNS